MNTFPDSVHVGEDNDRTSTTPLVALLVYEERGSDGQSVQVGIENR